MRIGGLYKCAALGAALLLTTLIVSCGGGSMASSNTPASSPATSTPTTAQAMVVVVMEENHSFEQVIGNAAMPYLNNLAHGGALATQYYATMHPSISNYFMLTTGAPQTNDNNFPGPVSADNLARELIAAGKTWKVYAEDLPSVGYVGTSVGNYIKHHNPFAYFDSVLNSTTQKANIVPFSQFASDLSNNALPNYAFVVPSNIHNGHDCPDGTNNCTLATKLIGIDNWLSANVGPVAQNSTFMSNGVLVVTFDESAIDNTNGGGKIAVVIAGGNIKTGFQSTTKYQFENLLRFTMDRLGVPSPGAGASAANMSEFVK